MAHFAQLDENNVVINVIRIADEDCLDENGNESEAVGITFCKNVFGEDTRWVQTSYNKNFRKIYAGIGHTYDPSKDAFIPEKAYPSFIFDENVWSWVHPVPHPKDGKMYIWDEPTLSWVLAEGPA